MEIGNYVNLFSISLDASSFTLRVTNRDKFPVLSELRARLSNCDVYAVRDLVYGFGSDLSELTNFGFHETTVPVERSPQLTNAIIKHGVSRHAKELGYEVEYGFSNRLFDRKNPLQTKMTEVSLFRGFEFRPFYFQTAMNEKTFFSLLLDLKFRLELNGKPASYSAVRNFASKQSEEVAHGVIRDIRVQTGDLTPTGGKNSEASRFRLANILNFVQKLSRVALYDKSEIRVAPEPVRIAGAY